MTDYTVTDGNDDFYTAQPSGDVPAYYYTTTLLYAAKINTVTPSLTHLAYINIDTSGIPDTDTITAATINFYAHSYTASKGVTKTYNVWFGGSVIYSGTFVSAGWVSHALTAGELANINKTGTSNFMISVDDPGVAKARTLTIRAYEYGGYTAYLSVTHAAASSAYYNISICTS